MQHSIQHRRVSVQGLLCMQVCDACVYVQLCGWRAAHNAPGVFVRDVCRGYSVYAAGARDACALCVILCAHNLYHSAYFY